MKKIKLLAPMFGAAAVVGAIAPVAMLTSCNKNNDGYTELKKETFVIKYQSVYSTYNSEIQKSTGGKMYSKVKSTDSTDFIDAGTKTVITSCGVPAYFYSGTGYYCSITFNKTDDLFMYVAGFNSSAIEYLENAVKAQIVKEKGVEASKITVQYAGNTDGDLRTRFSVDGSVCFELVIGKDAHIQYIKNDLTAVTFVGYEEYPIYKCQLHLKYSK